MDGQGHHEYLRQWRRSLDIEEKYGTDALRFVMATYADNQDVRLPVK